MTRTYEIKEINTPSIQNCWMLTEYTNNKISAAWGFRSLPELEDFLEVKIPILRK